MIDELFVTKLPLKNGYEIPQLGFGTWQLLDGREAHDATLTALENGYRHIDTAAIYGNERSVGQAILDSGLERADIFVSTKLWNSDHRDPLRAFQDSLERLDLSYIDLYLMHWPVPERNQTWLTLQQLVEEGRVRSLGVSNFTIQHLQDLPAPAPVVNQVEISPFLPQRDLVEYCADHDIVVEAYSPLTHGARIQEPVFERLGDKYERTPAQIMLRWAVQHELVVLPKSANPQHIKENGQIFDFEISDEDMLELDQLDEAYRTARDPSTLT